MRRAGLLSLVWALAAGVGCGRSEDPAVAQREPSQARAALSAGPATLVRDINVQATGSSPQELVDVGGTLFFPADDGRRGFELWKSDGTAAGTVLVKDIWPGAAAGSPKYLRNVNGTLFFVANDGVGGEELWKSDGTAEGTVRVKDIVVGYSGSSPANLTDVNGTLYFVASDATSGQELWKSDGTAAGTVRVHDIYAGYNGSAPASLTSVNGTLYFTADDGSTGRELWRSDGTAAGTVRVKDIWAGVSASSPQSLTAVGAALYFVAYDGVSGSELWKSDGTAAGTVRVKDIAAGAGSSSAQYLVNVNGTLYFSANDGATGFELWKSDGTAAGTVVVKDLRTSGSSDPQGLLNVNGALYFSANDGVSGTELWKSDGTAAGTVLVADVYPGSGSSSPVSLTQVNGALYFVATGASGEWPLWRTDGTAAGTVLVKNVMPGNLYAQPTRLTGSGGKLFFTAAAASSGWELWTSDGTAIGTQLVADLWPSTSDSAPSYLTHVSGTLYFTAFDPSSGWELWKSDGTAAGTVRVKDIYPGTGDSSPRYLTAMNGTLFFAANDASRGPQFWKSDGTAAGTVLVRDFGAFSASTSPTELTAVNRTLFLGLNAQGAGHELWKSDGTATGTVLVKDIYPGSSGSSLRYLVNVNGTLYFTANDGVSGQELWKSDGTTTGTVRVKDIYPGSSSSAPEALTTVNGTLYFVANDGVSGRELWKSDGTEVGTVRVQDIYAGINESAPADLTNVNGTLYFTAGNATSGRELWMSDGTPAGTVLVKDIYPGSTGSSPRLLKASNGALYFSAWDVVSGAELWKSDGTAAGTVRVKDIWPGANSGSPTYLVDVNGVLFFSAADEAHGLELWKSDGTSEGTTLVADIYEGATGSSPETIVAAGKRLFLSATTYEYGRELWSLGLNDAPVLTCPAPVQAEATSAAGVEVAYPDAAVTDDTTATPKVDASPASGSLFPLGRTTVTVTATDESGNQSKCSFDVTVLPAPPFVSGADKEYSTTSPLAVKGIAFGGAVVSFYSGATQLGTFTADAMGSFWGELSPPVGAHLLSATQSIAGVTSRRSPEQLVHIVPAAPVLTSPQDAASFGGRSVGVSGTGTPGATVAVYSDATRLDAAVVREDGSFLFGVQLPRYGTQVLTAVQEQSGERSVPSAARTVTAIPPPPVLLSPAQYATFFGPDAVVRGTSVPGARVTILDGGMAVGSLVVDAQGAFAGTVQLGFGTRTLQAVTVADGAESPPCAPVSVIVHVPEPTLTSPLDGATVGREVTVAGTALAFAQVVVSDNQGPFGAVTADAQGRFSVTAPVAYGDHTFDAWQQVDHELSLPSTPVHVRAVFNRAPTASGGSVALDEDVATPVVLGASDPDGDALSYDVVVAPAHGTLGGTAPNLVYTPAPDYAGPDAFAFTVADGQETSAAAEVQLVVRPVNDAPSALAHAVDLDEDGQALVTVEGSDTEGDWLAYTLVRAPAHGTLSGTLPDVTYSPEPNFHGEDSFAFSVTDGQLGSAPAEVSLRVRPVDDAPVAFDQTLATDEDVALAVTLVGHDVDGDALAYTVAEAPEHGTLSGIAPDLVYTPAPDYHGPDRFTFTVTDGRTTSAVATVTLSVASVNDAPVALAQSAATAEDAALTLRLAGRDVDGDALTFELVAQPAHGTLSGTPPEVTYTPAADFHGADAFTFRVSDGQVSSAPVEVALEVAPVNDAPVAQAQRLGTDEDLPVAVTLVGTDVDGDALGYALAEGPAHGTLRGTAPNLVYTPAADYHGADRLTFTVTDGQATSQPATVALEVGAVNDAPVAVAQAASTREDTSVALALSGADVDGDVLGYRVVQAPAHGTLSGTAPNLTYTPAADYAGSDRFTFVASDGRADSLEAAVQLTVEPVDDAPVAQAQPVRLTEDGTVSVTLSGRDVEGAALTFALVQPPAHGRLTGTPPELTYAPDADFSGTDTFTFTVNDGELTSTAATVTLTVAPVNDAPVAASAAYVLHQGDAQEVVLGASDADGDALDFELVDPPQGGTLSGTAPALTYRPLAGFRGEDHFAFRVKDAAGATSALATVALTVKNLAPLASAGASRLNPLEGEAVAFTATASDPGGDALTYAWDFGDGATSTEAEPVHAYANDGTYEVSLTVSDGLASTAVALTLAVQNASPLVMDVSTPASADEAHEVQFSARASDPGERDTLAYAWSFGDGTPAAQGAEVRHTYADDGTYTVTLTVTDDAGASAVSTREVRVANLAPEADSPGTVEVKAGSTVRVQLVARDAAGARDPLRWTLVEGPGAVTADGLYTWTTPKQANGTAYTVRARVADDEGASTDVYFTVNVGNVRQAAAVATTALDTGTSLAVAEEARGCSSSGGSGSLLALLSLAGLALRRSRRPSA